MDSAIEKLNENKEYIYNENVRTVIKSLRPYVGKRIDNYKPPPDILISKTKKLINNLNKKNLSEVKKLIDELQLEIIKYDFSENIIAICPKNCEIFHVTLLWRFGNFNRPLIIESPHEGKDDTLQSSINHFIQTTAKVLILNSVHPLSSDESAPCQQKCKISDPSHSVYTLFHQVHVQLSVLFPNYIYYQIHGMKLQEWESTDGNLEAFRILIVNGYNDQFRNNSIHMIFAKKIATQFTYEECRMIAICSKHLGKYNFDGKGELPLSNENGKNGVFRLPPYAQNTTVQGRQLNGGGQCSVGTEDTGRFIHIEMDPVAKGEWNDRIINTLNMALDQKFSQNNLETPSVYKEFKTIQNNLGSKTHSASRELKTLKNIEFTKKELKYLILFLNVILAKHKNISKYNSSVDDINFLLEIINDNR